MVLVSAHYCFIIITYKSDPYIYNFFTIGHLPSYTLTIINTDA